MRRMAHALWVACGGGFYERNYLKEIRALQLWLMVAVTFSCLLGLIVMQWEIYDGSDRVQCECTICGNGFLRSSAC